MNRIMLFILISFCLSFAQSTTTVYKNNKTLVSSNTFKGYIDSLGTTNKSLTIGTDVYISGKTTIPANIDLCGFNNGAKIKGNTGSAADTLVIMHMSAQPTSQIFDTSVTILFAPGCVTRVRPEYFGANAIDALDDTRAIQCAINSFQGIPGGVVFFSDGIYRISSTIYTRYKNGIYLLGTKPARQTQHCFAQGYNGTSSADSLAYSQIMWVGHRGDQTMINVDSLSQGFSMENLFLNANDSAGYCLIEKGKNSPAALTRGAKISYVFFTRYRHIGWVIGDTSTSLKDAQFEQINADYVSFYGGSNEDIPHIGLHVNAQNLELLNCQTMYFDGGNPRNRIHTNHIRQISGGILINGLVSTRSGGYSADTVSCPRGVCWDNFAIWSNDQLIINGWRSEDRKLLYKAAAVVKAPSMLMNVIQRTYGSEADTIHGVNVIDLNSSEGPVSLINCNLAGSVILGATNKIKTTLLNVTFTDDSLLGDRRVKYSGPRNQRGFIHTVDSGKIQLLGTSPSFELLDSAGTSKWAIKNGSIIYQSKTSTTITSSQDNYVLGDGSFFKLASNGDYNITGITGGESGRWMLLAMTNAHTLTFKSNSSSSASANQLQSVNNIDLQLSNNEIAMLIWDGAISKWRISKLLNNTYDSLYTSNSVVSGRLKFTTAITNKTGVTDGLIDVVCDTGTSNGLTMRGHVVAHHTVGQRDCISKIPLEREQRLIYF